MSADIDAAVKSGDFLGYICHTYLALTTLSAEVLGPPIFPRLSGMFTEKNVVLRTIRKKNALLRPILRIISVLPCRPDGNIGTLEMNIPRNIIDFRIRLGGLK